MTHLDAFNSASAAFQLHPDVALNDGPSTLIIRQKIVDAKAPETKSGMFRWRGLITGAVGC